MREVFISRKMSTKGRKIKMLELRRSDKGNAQQFGFIEFMSTVMSLFAIGVWGVWGVRRRRRGFGRRPRISSAQRRGRRRGGCGCGCFVIFILLPAIIIFVALVFFRSEIIEFIYNLTGFDLRRLRL